MKLLLIIATVIEAVAGLALLLIPTVAVSALLGVPLDTPTGLVAARIAGAVLVALAIDYNKDNFVYDMNQRGPIVGLGFKF